jgi:predicted transglutaminase-like cysteine proteinase
MAPVPVAGESRRPRIVPAWLGKLAGLDRVPRRLAVLALAAVLLPTSVGDGTAMTASARLFGADGIYSPDLGGFRKWRGVLERFARDLADPADADVRAWRMFVAAAAAANARARLAAVNDAVNGHRYVADAVNWGIGDYWASPIEFLRRNGDCEDFAVAKYMALRALGVSAGDMRVVVLNDLRLGITHAVLVVRSDGDFYVLDNQLPGIVPAAAIAHYRPIYAVNEDGWWDYGG